MMFNKKQAWLRAGLTGNRFKIPHSTCTNRYRQAEKTTVRRLTTLICAYFAEKVLFAENKMYICRIYCGE